jgi:hypothetical protein
MLKNWWGSGGNKEKLINVLIMFIFRGVEKVHFNRFARGISDKSSKLVTEWQQKSN